MKKVVSILLLVLVIFVFASCKKEPEIVTYEIGDTGPAGGLIFYDCDADNESGNADGLKSSECGWRYLEAATVDLPCIFGYYRESPTGSNQVVGTPNTGIGTGKANTEALVAAMGNEVYSLSSGSDKTANYAAKLCADYSAGGKDDWFLPSKAELNLMYLNLKQAGLGGFTDNMYWASNESGNTFAWQQNFANGDQPNMGRGSNSKARPIRAF